MGVSGRCQTFDSCEAIANKQQLFCDCNVAVFYNGCCTWKLLYFNDFSHFLAIKVRTFVTFSYKKLIPPLRDNLHEMEKMQQVKNQVRNGLKKKSFRPAKNSFFYSCTLYIALKVSPKHHLQINNRYRISPRHPLAPNTEAHNTCLK